MNTNELLSICIPTYNRASYLQELLQSIQVQFDTYESLRQLVRVYVFDNASTDDTPEIVKRFADVVYKRNAQNIGVDPNILQAYAAGAGKYVWAIGDDELLPRNAIDMHLQLIRTLRPHLLLARSPGYDCLMKLPLVCKNYQELALHCDEHNPHLLIAHGLISANVVRRDCFDHKLARSLVHTHHGHMYGLASGLKKCPGPVILPSSYTLIVRDRRAGFEHATTVNIVNSIMEPERVRYLRWLADEYALYRMRPASVVPEYHANTSGRTAIWRAARRLWRLTRRLFPVAALAWRSLGSHAVRWLRRVTRQLFPLAAPARRATRSARALLQGRLSQRRDLKAVTTYMSKHDR